MPDGRIGGSYPGGPRRRSAGDAEPEPTPLPSVEERGSRGRAARRSARERRRRRRAVGVLVAASVLAGGAGFVLGVQANRESEELTAEREQARTSSGIAGMLRGETDRVIQQMWLSEIIEREAVGPR